MTAERDSYETMVLLDDLESLREQLEEIGVSSRTEAEARLAAYPDEVAISEVLDLMEELGVEDLAALNARLTDLHVAMDQDEDVEEV